MKKELEIVKSLFGEDNVSQLEESQIDAISSKLNNLIESRVDAKVKFQTEVIEEEAKEKYDALLKQASQQYSKKLKSLEEQLISKAAKFKTSLEEAYSVTKTQLEEAKEKEVSDFKNVVVEKLDKYIALENKKNVPENYVEAVAKVQVLEPIVEGMKKTFKENYIRFDEENFSLLKDAKKEIVTTRKELAESTKNCMELNHELQEMKRTMKISKVCEGLTSAQKERTSKLLESYDVDEIETRFEAIRDIVIEGNVRREEKTSVVEDTVVETKTQETKKIVSESKTVKVDAEKETEEDVMSVGKVVTESVDQKALRDGCINDWVKEFKRISK